MFWVIERLLYSDRPLESLSYLKLSRGSHIKESCMNIIKLYETWNCDSIWLWCTLNIELKTINLFQYYEILLYSMEKLLRGMLLVAKDDFYYESEINILQLN